MSTLPLITIGILTYMRHPELVRTLTALHKHLRYPAERLRYIVADDASPDPMHIPALKRERICKKLNVEFLIAERNGGFGANANNLQARAFDGGDYLFFMEDDWILTRDIDLQAAVALMTVQTDVGYIRYRGHGGNDMIYQQREADVISVYPEYIEAHGLPARLAYFEIMRDSSSLYVYTNGPHLKHRRFVDYYGGYKEGLQVGKTEEAMAWAVKDGLRHAEAPKLVTLPEYFWQRFNHIGSVSSQGAAHDIVREGV